MTPETSPFRLTRLRIKNFRSIREADIPLGPLTVLVGTNGSGKSNVLDALRFMRDCLTRGVDQAVLDRKGVKNIAHWTAGSGATTVSLGVICVTDTGAIMAYDFTLAAEERGGFRIEKEEIRLQIAGKSELHVIQTNSKIWLTWDKKTRPVLSPRNLKKGAGGYLMHPALLLQDAVYGGFSEFDHFVDAHFADAISNAIKLGQHLMSALFYATSARALREPQAASNSVPFDEEGQNLGAVLEELLNDPIAAYQLRLLLRRLVAGVTDISVEPAGSYLVTYLHYETSGGVLRRADLGQESDGTLRALAILVALFQHEGVPGEFPGLSSDPHGLLAFEEPELHIHPGMLAVLAELFVVTSDRKQILLTTHSPELLDYLPLESFLIVEKVDGETQIGPLAVDQFETARRNLFTPGELLRTEGLHREVAPDAPSPTAE